MTFLQRASLIGEIKKGNLLLGFAILVAAIFCPSFGRAAIDRAFLKELLEIPSVTADVPAVNRAVDLTEAWLVRNGIRCQVETDGEGRKVLWASTVDGKEPDYVLVGHLDVVPAEADRFKVRFDGDRVYARGAADNKGNAYLTVRAVGKGGHSSRALWLDNPIEKLAQGYEKFRAAWPVVPKDGWGDLVVPTVIRAGQAENAIPDTAEMVLNVRSVSADAVARVTAVLKDVAGLEVVKVRSTGLPMASDPNDPEIRRLLAERRARWPEKNASLQRMLAITDARHFAGLGIPVVMTGSLGGNAHGKDEWGDMRNMDENADSLVAFLTPGATAARTF